MLLPIIGLHFVVGSIWLMTHDNPGFAIPCFVAGMAATHYGWKNLAAKKMKNSETSEDEK
jgi:hypothetical protein